VYVPTHVEPPESPRVRELSQRIRQLISDFQREYPMTPAEIREALMHAASSAGGDRRRFVAVMAVGVAAALGVGLFASRAAGSGGENPTMPIFILVGVLAAMAGLVLAIRRRG
jgi:hypothetical protein